MTSEFTIKLHQGAAKRQCAIQELNRVKKVLEEDISFLKELETSIMDARDNISLFPCVAAVALVFGIIFIPLGIKGDILFLSLLTRLSLLVIGVICLISSVTIKVVAIIMAERLPRKYIGQVESCLRRTEEEINEMQAVVQHYLDKLRWFEEAHYLDRGLVSILVKEFSKEGEHSTTTAALLYDIGVKFFNSVKAIKSGQQTTETTTRFKLMKPLIELTMWEIQMWIYSLQSGGQAGAADKATNKISDDIHIIMNEASTFMEFFKSVEKRDATSTLMIVNISLDKLVIIKRIIEDILVQFT